MGKIVTLNGKQHRPLVKIQIPYYDSLPASMMEICEHITMGNSIPGYQVALTRKETTIITFGRNELIADPPGIDNWDYLFFLDDDMGFDNETLRSAVYVDWNGQSFEVPMFIGLMKKILDHDLNICGGLYCQRGTPYMPQVFKTLTPEHTDGPWINMVDPPESGVHEVDAIATGFLCIKRRVFKAFDREFERRHNVTKEYRAWLEKQENLDAIPPEVQRYLGVSRPDLHPPFWHDYIIDPTKKTWVNVGEDIFFCKEAKKLGFKIYCDFDVQLGHLANKWVTPGFYRLNTQEEVIEGHKQFCKEHDIVSPVLEAEDG